MDIATAGNGAGGQAAPASGKQQSGSAAPAGNGNAAGNPSSPSDNAIVAAKKQAEHWQKKYERDVGGLTERLAKLEGMAQGLSGSQQVAPKAPARTIEDVDDAGIEAIVKRGFEESNPGFVTESIREIARRQSQIEAKAAEERSRAHLEQTIERQRVNAKIASEFGAEEVLNEDSDLRQRADSYLSGLIRKDPKILEKVPDVAYLCFAKAKQDLAVGEKGELERLRRDEAQRLANDEIQRSSQQIAKRARDDVKELLDRRDMKGAISKRLDWIVGKRTS